MSIAPIGVTSGVPKPEGVSGGGPVRFEVQLPDAPARPRGRVEVAPVPVHVARPAPLEVEPWRGNPVRWPRIEPGAWLGRVAAAQARMDRILALAASGRTFSPAELLSLQAGVAEASQTVDLAGKVLDRMSGGVRTLLQTQV
jgi:hypothetical protein